LLNITGRLLQRNLLNCDNLTIFSSVTVGYSATTDLSPCDGGSDTVVASHNLSLLPCGSCWRLWQR